MSFTNYKRICPFSSYEELAPDVQKVICHVLETQYEYDKIDYTKLEGVLQILNTWYLNKYDLLKSRAFDKSLIVELEEVAIQLTPKQKEKFITDFIYELQNHWEEMFPDFPEYDISGHNLGYFLKVNFDGFFQNKTTHSFEAPDNTIIEADCKISKNFKHFFDNEELIRQAQDKYSEYIQKDKLTGTLCASIHPLDFLSSSENNYHWRSCHALNGDYCGGNMSYIMDDCSIIFYIKGKDNVKLPRFPDDVLWNDKKWRMLACFDYKYIAAGRQYPFFNEELLEPIKEFLSYIASYIADDDANYFSHWHHDYIDSVGLPIENSYTNKTLSYPYLYYKGVLCTKFNLIKNAKYTANYNDLLYSSCYEPYFAFCKHYTMFLDDLKPVEVGHAPICACCGEEKTSMGNDEFICGKCIDIINPTICAECGKPIVGESGEWVKNLGLVCSKCFSKFSWICPDCGNKISVGVNSCWHCELDTIDIPIMTDAETANNTVYTTFQSLSLNNVNRNIEISF